MQGPIYILIYYINVTSETPGELSHINMISSHLKITCYFTCENNLLLKDHHCYNYTILYLHKSHNTTLLPPEILHNHCLQFLLGHEDVPMRNLKQCVCNFLWGKRGVLWDCASRESLKKYLHVLLYDQNIIG